MKIIFSFLSGLGDSIFDFTLFLNKKSDLFFKTKKLPAKVFSRITIIMVTGTLSKVEKEKYKSKYITDSDKLGISIYIDNTQFENSNLKNKLEYIHHVLIESLDRNTRLKKIEIDISKLIKQLNNFFGEVILENKL